MKGYKCFMSLKFGLQVLLESCYMFFMKEVTGSLWDKCNFVLIYSRIAFFCTNKWAVIWDFQQCGMCERQRLRPACAYAQSGQSLCKSLKTIDWLALGVLKLKRKPHRLVWAYSCQNATLSMCGSRGVMGSRPLPPWKITSYSYMGFYRNCHLDPLENV